MPCRQPGGTLAGAHRSCAEELCLAAGTVGPRSPRTGTAGRRWRLFCFLFGICDSAEARTAEGRIFANELLLPRDKLSSAALDLRCQCRFLHSSHLETLI